MPDEAQYEAERRICHRIIFSTSTEPISTSKNRINCIKFILRRKEEKFNFLRGLTLESASGGHSGKEIDGKMREKSAKNEKK